ncbi:MAG TPA: sulfatase-like hydrolase/transferase [Bryobacterales bacterium]|nr:sulfatase-like hydrolase/transferase [Bryobacterales bacterium]
MAEPLRQLSRRRFAAGFGAALGGGLVRAARSDRPNIVFICSDQHSGRVLGCNGHREVRTPHLDRLASLGMNFRNAYCGSPVCVPSRAGFMTGMYPSDVGSYCNSTPFDGRVPTWGNRLRAAGYDCWATGKLDLEAGKDYGGAVHRRGRPARGQGTSPRFGQQILSVG